MGEQKRRYSAHDGVARTSIIDDDAPGRLVIKTEQDVEPILDSIHRDRELMPNTGYNKLAARIPVIIYEQLYAQGIVQDEDRFKAWLNSDEATPWRIWKGRL